MSELTFNLLPPQKQIHELHKMILALNANVTLLRAGQGHLSQLMFNLAVEAVNAFLVTMPPDVAKQTIASFQAALAQAEKQRSEDATSH